MAYTVTFSNGALFVANEAGDIVAKQEFLPPVGENHQSRPFNSEQEALEWYENNLSGQFPKVDSDNSENTGE